VYGLIILKCSVNAIYFLIFFILSGIFTYIASEQSLGVVILKKDLEQRARELADYVIENNATVRSAAKKFGISKSTVHKDLSQRL